MTKHTVFFDRLSALKPSSAALALLQKSALPRLGYLLRTHAPHLTADAAAQFDTRIYETFLQWADVASTHSVSTRCSLPTALGGIGLTRQKDIATLAYEASRTFALSTLRNLEGQAAPDQHTATGQLHDAQLEAFKSSEPSEIRHLTECAIKGSATWLTAPGVTFQGPEFSAALRYRLNAPPRNSPPFITCRGCDKIFTTEAFDAHAAGCVCKPGFNATAKHNTIVQLLGDMCDEACLKYELEPRELEAYRCHRCTCLVNRREKSDHFAVCRAQFSRTGPDIRIFFPSGSVVYDVTVAHTTAASYGTQSPESIIAQKTTRKTEFYTPHLGDEPFVVLPARALGAIEKPLSDLVRTLAHEGGTTTVEALARVSVALARGVGHTLVSARRTYWNRA